MAPTCRAPFRRRTPPPPWTHLDGCLPQGLQALPAALLHVDHIPVVALQGPLESVDGLEDGVFTFIQLFLENFKHVHLKQLLLVRKAGIFFHCSDCTFQFVKNHSLLAKKPGELSATVQDPLPPLGDGRALAPVPRDGGSHGLFVLRAAGQQVKEREPDPEVALPQYLHDPILGTGQGSPKIPAKSGSRLRYAFSAEKEIY